VKKRCSVCGKRKPGSEFYLNKKSPDGLQYMCKPCTQAYRRERYKRIKDQPLRPKEKLRCAVCQELKSHTLFGPGNRASGKNSYCRSCANKRARDERKNTRGRSLAICNRAKQRAKRRGIQYTLDEDRVRAVMEAGKCEATGLPFDLDDPHSPYSPSLDRKDSSKGYTDSNTWVVVLAFNLAKNRWTSDQLVEVVEAFKRCRRRKD